MLKIKIENCWRIISLIVFFCLQFFCSTIDAQTISVTFNVLDSSELSTSKYFKKEQLKSSFELENLLRKKSIEWIDKGFFLVSFETKKQTDNQFVVSVELGRKFKKITVELEEKDRWQLRKFNVSLAKSNAKFTANEFSTLLKNGLNAFLDNGYPFIAISFENLEIVEDEISLQLKFDRGMIFRWTEIHIKGDSSISVNAIENSIGIRKGDFFNESLLAQVDKRIEQLSFITKIKASELLFTEKGVELFLYLKSQKISSVQGAIGLQPNPITQTMVLTGDLQMKLANVFKKAESVDLSWRSIQPQTQSLNFKLVYPYLFKSPFGIDARFNLYKRDSTFLDLKSALGVVYTLKNGSQLKASYQLLASNLLFASASSSEFSNLAKVRTNSYGISYTHRKLDYIPNPSKGRFLNVEAFIGSRTATKDSVSEKKNVARASIQFDNYFSLAKRHVLKLSAGFETYYAPQVFQNELYRFGGLNSLRGFNEDELFASTKLSYTLEYRFLVDRNSNAFLFFEQAFYENNSSNYLKDNPFGVGTGFSFGTKLGIFTISYAVGKQLTNPFDFRLSKIHFGYTAYF
jgi:outer membrane protein assembly factor BamA